MKPRRRNLPWLASLGASAAVLVALAVVGVAPADALAPRATESVPSTIPSDCSTDVTKALTKWIESVSDGSTLEFAKNGCYRLDGSLMVTDRSGLTFDGNGATLKAVTEGNRDRVHVFFIGDKNLTVRDLTVRGVNPARGRHRAGLRSGSRVPTRFQPSGGRRRALRSRQGVRRVRGLRLRRYQR